MRGDWSSEESKALGLSRIDGRIAKKRSGRTTATGRTNLCRTWRKPMSPNPGTYSELQPFHTLTLAVATS